jgi:hypothetical protein
MRTHLIRFQKRGVKKIQNSKKKSGKVSQGPDLNPLFHEACGIMVEGENKWMTLIQNAAQAK